MTNYNELSDYELNVRAAEELNLCVQKPVYKNQRHVHVMVGYEVKCFDPCNNPADAWPIIVENEISVIRDTSTNDVWEAIPKAWYTSQGVESRYGDEFIFIDKKPLRAAMIVFLMMNEKERK